VLPGCGGSETKAPEAPAVAKDAPKADSSAAVVQQTASMKDYRYNPKNKPDPFRPFILIRKANKVEESPLQRYDLTQLQLTAVVWNVNAPKAMVADPTGHSHVIQIGSDIGKNRGVVTKIADREVQVRETYVDYLGNESKKIVTLKIVQPDLYGEES
jgi:Tfp pilus assembly protein PilP